MCDDARLWRTESSYADECHRRAHFEPKWTLSHAHRQHDDYEHNMEHKRWGHNRWAWAKHPGAGLGPSEALPISERGPAGEKSHGPKMPDIPG